ncbi:hypothetical protein [Micromonospora chersina]|uniref:hypothetical protein n=1 Tax=Micromonospora chersina TaxID=47854 RepID=UPI0033D9EB3E
MVAAVALLLAGLGLAWVHQSGAQVRNAPPLNPSPPAAAKRFTTGPHLSSWTQAATKDFVIEVDLGNPHRDLVRVQAAATPDHPGFSRLIVAVLAGAAGEEIPSYTQVAAAAPRTVTLGPHETARLVIAGRVSCGTPMLTHGSVDLVVDGEQTSVDLPKVNHEDWSSVALRLC